MFGGSDIGVDWVRRTSWFLLKEGIILQEPSVVWKGERARYMFEAAGCWVAHRNIVAIRPLRDR